MSEVNDLIDFFLSEAKWKASKKEVKLPTGNEPPHHETSVGKAVTYTPPPGSKFLDPNYNGRVGEFTLLPPRHPARRQLKTTERFGQTEIPTRGIRQQRAAELEAGINAKAGKPPEPHRVTGVSEKPAELGQQDKGPGGNMPSDMRAAVDTAIASGVASGMSRRQAKKLAQRQVIHPSQQDVHNTALWKQVSQPHGPNEEPVKGLGGHPGDILQAAGMVVRDKEGNATDVVDLTAPTAKMPKVAQKMAKANVKVTGPRVSRGRRAGHGRDDAPGGTLPTGVPTTGDVRVGKEMSTGKLNVGSAERKRRRSPVSTLRFNVEKAAGSARAKFSMAGLKGKALKVAVAKDKNVAAALKKYREYRASSSLGATLDRVGAKPPEEKEKINSGFEGFIANLLEARRKKAAETADAEPPVPKYNVEQLTPAQRFQLGLEMPKTSDEYPEGTTDVDVKAAENLQKVITGRGFNPHAAKGSGWRSRASKGKIQQPSGTTRVHLAPTGGPSGKPTQIDVRTLVTGGGRSKGKPPNAVEGGGSRVVDAEADAAAYKLRNPETGAAVTRREMKKTAKLRRGIANKIGDPGIAGRQLGSFDILGIASQVPAVPIPAPARPAPQKKVTGPQLPGLRRNRYGESIRVASEKELQRFHEKLHTDYVKNLNEIVKTIFTANPRTDSKIKGSPVRQGNQPGTLMTAQGIVDKVTQARLDLGLSGKKPEPTTGRDAFLKLFPNETPKPKARG